jgi:hypothetical protein
VAEHQDIEELAKLISAGASDQTFASVRSKLLESANLVLLGSDLQAVRRLWPAHAGFLSDAIRGLQAADQRDLLRKWNPHRRPSADESRGRDLKKELIGLANGTSEPAAFPSFDPKDTESHTFVWLSYIALGSGILLLAGVLYVVAARTIWADPSDWSEAAAMAFFGSIATAAGAFLLLRCSRQLRARWRALDAGAPDLSRKRLLDNLAGSLLAGLWYFPFAVVAAVAVFMGSLPSVEPK